MENILLGLLMAGVFVFGYFLVNRLGQSVETNRKGMYVPQNREKRPLALLTGGKDPAEITRAIERFSDRHGNRTVIVCMDEDSDLFGLVVRKAKTGEIELK